MPEPILLPVTGKTINNDTDVSGLLTTEIAEWIRTHYSPGGGGPTYPGIDGVTITNAGTGGTLQVNGVAGNSFTDLLVIGLYNLGYVRWGAEFQENLSGNVDHYTTATIAGITRLNLSSVAGPVTLGGIDASSAGTGQMLILQNGGADTITLLTTPAAPPFTDGFQILTPYDLIPNASVLLRWNGAWSIVADFSANSPIPFVSGSANDVLTFNGSAWGAASGDARGTAGGALTGTYPNPTLASAVLNALATVMSSTATAAAQRTALGLGSAALSATGDFDASGAAAAAQAAAIAASQPLSSVLTALASVMSATATAAAQRTALGLGAAALLAVGTSAGTVAAGNDARFSTITGNNQTGTTYTFVLTDAGEVVEGNNGAGIAFTIPPVSSVVWPVGTVIEVWQQGAGQITLTAGAGVTLRSDGAKVKTAAQYATVRARMRANDEWVLSGDLA